MAKCTLIIVNWNSWEYLFSCLDAVYRQSLLDFELIVVDNGSSDQESASRLGSYPRLTYLYNEKNVGFAAANNQAIGMAKNSEWIVLLNPDTLPEKNWLSSLCEAAAASPDFSFFGSLLVRADAPEILDGTGDVYHLSGLPWRAGHGLEMASVPAEPWEIFSPCAAAAMYRRQDLLAVGGFDEDYFCYSEDVDLGFRLRLAGHRALTVPASVVLHHGSGTTGVRSDFAVYHGHRNLVWTWFKDMPLLLLIVLLPLHLFYALACIALYARRGQGRVIVQAKWDAFKGLPKMLAKRKAIHTEACLSLSSLWSIMKRCLFVGPGKKYSKI